MTDLYRYVIVEEPTALEPTKLPRLCGKVANPSAIVAEPGVGEVIVQHNFSFMNLSTWQGTPFTWSCCGKIMTEDTSNHQRRWVVEYNGGDYQVVETDPPLISRTYVYSKVTASLTIT